MYLLAILISLLSGAAFIALSLQIGRGNTELRTDLTTIKENSIHTLMKLSALSSVLTNIETTVTKIQAEVTALVENTRDVDLPADAQATLDRLQALVSTVDTLIPDEIVNGTGVSQV